jgi:general secretion pathway protein H
VLVVVVILGIVAAASVPAISGRFGGALARAASRDVVIALRQTRGAAIASNIDLAFAIDTDARTYAIEGGRTRQLPQALDVALFTAEAERLSRSAGSIRFFPDGSSTGGEITLTGPAGDATVIRVDWLTGHVRELPATVEVGR